ncbi:MAG: hypothetical protein M1608_10800 [Candidatus Omnitrophica bacterium]|nr:hypothetical protein [Candidatus Omnitrophota bacterium]
MLERSSSIAYRYCPAEAAKALELTHENHAKFVAYYGSDLAVFPDGLALAAAEQKRMGAQWRERDAESIARVMREQGVKHPRPWMAFPPELLKHDQGIAAFSNPDEGVEVLVCFNQVFSGLRKKGVGLADEEMGALRNAMMDEAISQAFVRRLASEHGAESWAEAFLIRNAPVELALEFLLRRNKGHIYRKRYPSSRSCRGRPSERLIVLKAQGISLLISVWARAVRERRPSVKEHRSLPGPSPDRPWLAPGAG